MPSPKRMIARMVRELMVPVVIEVKLQTMQATASMRLRFILLAAFPK